MPASVPQPILSLADRLSESLAALPAGRREAAQRELASLFTRQGLYEHAGRLLAAALEACQALDDRSGQAGCLRLQAELAAQRGRPELAVEPYEQAAALYRQLGQVEPLGYLLAGLGLLYEDLGAYESATRTYAAAETALLAAGHPRSAGTCLHRRAGLHARQGELGPAIDCYQRGVALELANASPNTASDNLLRLGALYRKQARLDLAQASFQQVVDLWEQPETLEASIMRQGPAGPARRFAERARDHNLAWAWFRLAQVQQAQGQVDPALHAYRQAMHFASQIDYTSLVSLCLRGLGDLYLQRGDFGQARQCFLQSLPHLDEHPDSDSRGWRASDWGELAACLAGLGRLEQALAAGYFRQAQAIYQALDQPEQARLDGWAAAAAAAAAACGEAGAPALLQELRSLPDGESLAAPLERLAAAMPDSLAHSPGGPGRLPTHDLVRAHVARQAAQDAARLAGLAERSAGYPAAPSTPAEALAAWRAAAERMSLLEAAAVLQAGEAGGL